MIKTNWLFSAMVSRDRTFDPRWITSAITESRELIVHSKVARLNIKRLKTAHFLE